MSSFSPGPWRVLAPPNADHGNPWRVAGGAHTIAIVPNWPREADARLIAAAPELLAIVKEHLDDHLEACHITRRGDVCVLVRQTQEIIAKAEGRTP